MLGMSLCLHCQGACNQHQLLCSTCQAELFISPASEVNRCQRCSLPLARSLDPDPEPGTGKAALVCGECLAQPPSFHTTVCATHHQQPFSDWLNRFKQKSDLLCGELLITQLTQHISNQYTPNEQPDWLVPTPLHWRKQWLRGFNQAAWVAKQLSKSLGIPCLPALQRIHKGNNQKALNRRQRLTNLRKTFRLNPKHQQAIVNKHLILVDDVMTTGATARVLSKLLMDNGAARVDVWCLTRTPKHQ